MRKLILIPAILIVFLEYCAGFSTRAFLRAHSLRDTRVKLRQATTIDSPALSFQATVSKDALLRAKTEFPVDARRFRKFTKQVATLGPACFTLEMIEKLFLSGADVFRLNFSHGEHHEKEHLIQLIRQVEHKYNHPIAILADLQGPKLRVGIFADAKVHLKEGQLFSFDLKNVAGNHERVRLPHPEILYTLRVGDSLILDDGKLRMVVVNTTMGERPVQTTTTFTTATATATGGAVPGLPMEDTGGSVTCEVLVGGTLSNKKGVNTPSVVLPISPLTEKDRRDLDFILSLDGQVDWIALSFVQQPADMLEFRRLAGDNVKLMAKLEKPSAIDSLEEIVALSDGIMVARGDLGVEMNPWDVPVVQKRIVETCKLLGKPVVIATQMMESMINHPTPTRAEASDTATAIYDSSDAVMLSAESAAGKYPIESVTMQQLVINKVETDEMFRKSLDRFADEFDHKLGGKNGITNAITIAARQVADISNSKVIIAFTATGGTALRMAKMRPKVPILAICDDIRVARALALVWGVYPIMKEPHVGEFNIKSEIDKVCRTICAMGFANPATELVTVTAGLPWGSRSTTNIIRVTSAAGTGYWFDKEGKLKQYGQGSFHPDNTGGELETWSDM